MNNILNTIINYFNTLDFNLRIFLSFILLIIALVIIFKILKLIKYTLVKCCRCFYLKFKSSSEKKFNTLLAGYLTKKINSTNKFIAVCNFEFTTENNNQLELLSNFAQAFTNYFKVSVKFDKNSLIFVFENFSSTINNVLDQLYLIKKSREKQYKGLNIYISISEIEEDSKYEEQLRLLKKINSLKVKAQKIITNASFSFYYSTITPQKYVITSSGYYMLGEITELFTVELPVRTL